MNVGECGELHALCGGVEGQVRNTGRAVYAFSIRIEQQLMQEKVGERLVGPVTHVGAQHINVLRKLR